MPLSRPLHRFSLVALAIAFCLLPIGLLGTTSPAIAQERPDCANFLDAEDAQVALAADPTDPLGLDEQGAGDGEACEQPDGRFGTTPLVNCDDLQDDPDIARALYEHSLEKYDSDRYDLAGCIEQGGTGTEPSADDCPNQGRQRDDPEVLDGVPPEADGGTAVVRPVAFDPAQTLEARLETRFAALEAQFAAFEARAANGFGMFPESGDGATAEGQASSVDVSAFQRPIRMTQRTGTGNDRPIVQAQKTKEVKGDQNKERKTKRNRHRDKDCDRR